MVKRFNQTLKPGEQPRHLLGLKHFHGQVIILEEDYDAESVELEGLV